MKCSTESAKHAPENITTLVANHNSSNSFHLVKTPTKKNNKHMSSSDKCISKPTRENIKHIHFSKWKQGIPDMEIRPKQQRLLAPGPFCCITELVISHSPALHPSFSLESQEI